MPRNEERSPFDLRDLQRIMDNGAGPAEVPDTVPVLRLDVIDGLQAYLAKCHRAQSVLEASGYFDILDEARAILADNPEVSTFLASIKNGAPAAAYSAITDIGRVVT